VRYFQVMAEAKLQVMGHGAAPGRGGGDVGNGLIYGVLHRRLWLEALGAAMGLDLDPPDTPSSPAARDHSWMYDALLEQFRFVVPRIADPLAQQHVKGLARIVKYLQQVDALGASYDADELADLRALLGADPVTLDAGRAAVADGARSGEVDDRGYLRYLWRRVSRETELARPAMGVLADRHWPALR
jgi:hypothetical protein